MQKHLNQYRTFIHSNYLLVFLQSWVLPCLATPQH